MAQNDDLDIGVFADSWIREHNFKTRTDSETTYYYKNGVYIPADKFIEQLAEKGIPQCRNYTVKEVKGTIKRRTYTECDTFSGNPFIINVQNGLLDLRNGEMLQHDPSIITTVQLPIIYDSRAECPNIDEFLEQVLKSDDRELVYEIAGWLLWKQYHIHKAIMLYGHGRNGKGTLLRLLESFLGINNCSHVSLQKLVSDRFAPVDLVGKAANIFGDLPKRI